MPRHRMTYHHVQMGWAVIVGSVAGFGLALLVTLSLSAATLAPNTKLAVRSVPLPDGAVLPMAPAHEG